MVNYVVIRNGAYTRSDIRGINLHNERFKDEYRNPDIDSTRSRLNIHFKKPAGLYAETLAKLVDEKKVSLRGLKGDAVLFGEFLLDVNTKYFEENGGYEFARDFYEEAYQFCCKEVGEENIISATMHADERNRALSEEVGHDVWHYHMHVVYLPVVTKEIKYTKRCKDPALVGTVKEVITQISHSKRWKSEPMLGEDGEPLRDEKGKAILAPSYAVLQTRFAEHMQARGYTDVERGVAGKRAKHKSIVEYKLEQDVARAKAAAAKADRLESVSAQLAVDIEAQREALTDLKDMTEYTDEVATCRTILQEIFDAITTFFSRASLLRDKKAEATFFEKLREALVSFFSRLRNLLGFELLTEMPLDRCQSPQLAMEGEKLALDLQIAAAEQRTTETAIDRQKREEYTR